MSVKELKLSAVEINAIFENMPNEIFEKIPLGVKDFFKQIASDSYHFEYDKSKRLDEQNLMPKTKGVLALLYRDYICNEKERNQFIEHYNSFLKKKTQVETTNVENISEIAISQTCIINQENLTSLTKSDKWYTKLFNWIKNIFSK